jgi:hypothetical protein
MRSASRQRAAIAHQSEITPRIIRKLDTLSKRWVHRKRAKLRNPSPRTLNQKHRSKI